MWDPAAIRQRFADVGMPEETAPVWFALLRDGIALSTAGSTERFSVIAEGTQRYILAGPVADLHAAVGHVTSGFLELPVRPDVG